MPFQFIQGKPYRPVKELDMSSVKSQKKKIDNAIATTNLSCASVIARLFDSALVAVWISSSNRSAGLPELKGLQRFVHLPAWFLLGLLAKSLLFGRLF